MYRAYVDFKCSVKIENSTSDWFPMRCGIHQGGFLSLTKYVAFVNGLLEVLEQSRLCCTIGRIPSTPVGYADDVATACITKLRTDKALQIVHEFGLKWRFKFNAKKSAILVYGESKHEQDRGSKYRTFRLGKEKVDEKSEYDHVGIKACTLKDSNQRIEDKLSKGRRTLNAASGLGIRKNGLTLKTCNLIFWTIVIPIVTFGSEIWYLSDSDLEKLQNFQRYAGRRVQRFPKRSPNCSSYYGLGWIRIETFIQVKKLLFLLTYLYMQDDNRQKQVFVSRVRDYVINRNAINNNPHCSPVFDMLDTSVRFDLLEPILEMVLGDAQVTHKKAWSKLVWEKAWSLDDAFWKSTRFVYSKNDLLCKTVGNAHYLTWWHIADNAPYLQGMCETMARLVCHASQLKGDDPRYKKESLMQKICHECNLGTLETIFHVIMQCPANEQNTTQMFNDIKAIDNDFDDRSRQAPGEVFYWIMGKNIPDIDVETMTNIWVTAGMHISAIYKAILRKKVGIG